MILSFLISLLFSYSNPVIYADYSDPDVVSDGKGFWMTASSFNCVPGLPILHSFDLVNWELVNYAIPEGSRYWKGATSVPDHGNGIWAPSIRINEGIFYIFWGDPDRGIFQVHTDNPSGEWSEPACVVDGRGLIDPCPLWDDDGKVYLVHGWAKSRCGFNGVLNVVRLNTELTAAAGPDSLVFDGNGTGNYTIEGPKFYKRGNFYYIFAPAGGVKEGWQTVLRSEAPFGPYTWRKVLHRGESSVHGPHQGAWVDDAAGAGWFLHFEDRYAWGRVVHLQPLTWQQDGWCTIGVDSDGDGVGEPVSEYDFPAAYDSSSRVQGFDSGHHVAEGKEHWMEFGNNHHTDAVILELDGAPASDGLLHCQWHSDPSDGWMVKGKLLPVIQNEGWKNLWNTPNLYLRKIVGPKMIYYARIVLADDGLRSGVVVMGCDYSTIEITRDCDSLYLQRRTCLDADKGACEVVSQSVAVSSNCIDIRVTVNEIQPYVKDNGDYCGYGAECLFYYKGSDGEWIQFGPPFAARAGRWIGAKVGLFSIAR